MKTRLLIPVLLCLAFVAQSLWFIGTQSLTFDEPAHMVAGLDMWQAGKFVRWNDHPPLSRALFALPLLGKDWGIDFVFHPDDWNDHSSKAWLTWVPRDPQGIAWRARSMNLLLGLALGALLWIAARRLFSVAAANLALLLFAFTPSLIAHFSVATTDGAGVLMIFAVAMQVVAWRRDPSRFHTTLLGLALGGMLIAKFYTPPLFLLALGLTLGLDHGRHWRKVACAAAIAFVVILAAYRFHVSWLMLQNGQLAMHSPGAVYKLGSVPKVPSFSIPVPAGEYLTGLIDVFRHNRWGHPSFFLGEISQSGGWKLYYPVLIALKWPTVVLLLCLGVAGLCLSRRVRMPPELGIMLLFPAVFLLFSIFSKIDIGDRHVLPVLPFLLLICGSLAQLEWRRGAFIAAVVVVAALHIGDALRYAPDYLSYFNPFVSPTNSYRLLSDSNIDWGEGLIALCQYRAAHPKEPIHLAYFGSVYPSGYHLDVQPLREDQRATGTVVVSATHLSGQLLRRPGSYKWLLQYPRTAILNHTLHVFQVPAGAIRAVK
jgi:hypothetical protein